MACQSSYTGSNVHKLSNSTEPVTARVASARRWRNLWVLLTIVVALAGATLVAQASTPILVGYRDHQYPSGVAGNREVTSEKPESKLWWNDGYWWASVYSNTDDRYNIFRLEEGTQTWVDTGTALDDRIESRADVLWADNKLYVVSHLWDDGGQTEDPEDSGRLYRYSYDAGTDTYTLDEDDGFPVEVNDASSESLVIAKDSTGQLWVTWTQGGSVMVNHSVGGEDSVWATPFALDDPAATGDGDDLSSIIAYGDHVGIMWSNQDGDEEMYFAVHEVNTDPELWTVELAFSITGDDHINLKRLGTDDDGNIYAVIKGGSSSHLIVVLVCEWDASSFCSETGDWDYAVVYDTKDHNPTRPAMLIDTSNNDLYVFTRNVDENDENGIYYKVSDLDNLNFSTGDIGIPFIKSESETGINDPTSTKQNVNSATGLAVLASDKRARYYFHNFLELDGIGQHTLTVNTSGSGSVDPPSGVHVYDDGTEVTLTATPDPDWQFVGWSGDLSDNTNPVTITMDADKTVTAVFSEVPPDQRTLTVHVSPGHGGSVTLDPPGGVYEAGTVVSLTATPSDGWIFTGWSGDLSGTDEQTTITMDSNKTVTASFAQIQDYMLTVNWTGAGGVAMDPAGGTYQQGTEVTLTATPDAGWNFSGWSGDLTGSDNPTTIVMDSNKTVAATFLLAEYALTVYTAGEGSVTLDPPGGAYGYGEIVTLTANPDPGWTFSSWSGDLIGSDNPATITMDAGKTVSATFVQEASGIQIQVSANPVTATLAQDITYTYIVANIGEATLNDVVVNDDRLGAVTLDKTTLVSGETAVGQLTYRPVTGDLPGPLENTATATATSILDEEVSDSHTVSVALRQLSFVYYMPLGLSNLPATAQNEEQTAPEGTEEDTPGLIIIRELGTQD